MSAERIWRQFERLVALIEAQAAPRAATVKSPDRIRDMVTGHLREVDASIRFMAGTTEILVTLECRTRGRKADDTWIEQLATKRQRVGAAKTIAVSANGFTESAIRSAKLYGIELRTLSEIRLEEVQDWFLPHGIVHIFRSIDNIACRLELTSDTVIEVEDYMEPIFHHALVHTPFPAVAFVNFIDLKDPKCFWNVPLDGSLVRLVFDLDATAPDIIPVPLGVPRPEGARLQVRHDGALAEVRRIVLTVDFSYETASFESAAGTHHLYKSPDGAVTQHSRFTGEVFGQPVTFDHQSDPEGQSLASVEFSPGLRIDSSWLALDEATFRSLSEAAGTSGTLPRSQCGLCGERSPLPLCRAVPDYLLPEGASVGKERLLCSACGSRFADLDAYGKELLDCLPQTDLRGSEGHALRFDGADYGQLRLWLLSLLWRMHVATEPVWKGVQLGSAAAQIRALLLAQSPGKPDQYPAYCVIPSLDGRRLNFVLEPDTVDTKEGPLVRAILGGFLFLFSLGEAARQTNLCIVPGEPWTVPVFGWRQIDFLKHWIESKFRGAGRLAEPAQE